MTGSNKLLQERVAQLEDRVSALEKKLESGVEVEAPLRAFIEEVNPSTHVERAITIGYHLESNQNFENFTIEDVEDGYRDCKMPTPANLSDVLAGAQDQGWAMRDGKDGQYQLWMLTREGEEFVKGAISE